MEAFIHQEILALFKRKLPRPKTKPLAKCCEN